MPPGTALHVPRRLLLLSLFALPAGAARTAAAAPTRPASSLRTVATMPPGAAQRVAVLFAECGSGFGDVGKFCVAQGREAPGVEVVPVALSAPSERGLADEITADVTYESGRHTVYQAFATLPRLPRVDITSDGAQAEIEAELAGCDAVVACLGNRQPGKEERWCGLGARKVVAAMQAAGVRRLVNLSSMGIGDDYLPTSGWKLFWAAFLRLVIPGARKDLYAMEEAVTTSGLDFLQVRAMGVTPEEPPRGEWAVIERRGQGDLLMMTSKEDVAAFMLQEAVTPTRSGISVTMGYPKK